MILLWKNFSQVDFHLFLVYQHIFDLVGTGDPAKVRINETDETGTILAAAESRAKV